MGAAKVNTIKLYTSTGWSKIYIMPMTKFYAYKCRAHNYFHLIGMMKLVVEAQVPEQHFCVEKRKSPKYVTWAQAAYLNRCAGHGRGPSNHIYIAVDSTLTYPIKQRPALFNNQFHMAMIRLFILLWNDMYDFSSSMGPSYSETLNSKVYTNICTFEGIGTRIE